MAVPIQPPDPRRTEALNVAHAKKLAARADGTAKMQRYGADRGAGPIADIRDPNVRHAAKLEARIAAFNAGRKPDENGHLDVAEPKADAKAAEPKPVAAKDEDAALEAATRPEPKPKADAKARG